MTTVFVLDTRGVEAAADPAVSARFRAAIAAARRRGTIRLIAPSAVLIEAFPGHPSTDVAIDRMVGRGECDVVERLPVAAARRAASRRQRHPAASAIDALVAETAAERPGSFILTSDHRDLEAIRSRRTTVLAI